jgi:chorismate mutase
MMRSVRGATTVSKNDAAEIKAAVEELVETLLSKNHISVDAIVSVFFAVTPDLSALNPASAIRQVRSDWQYVPMLCTQEPITDGMLSHCIRLLIQWNTLDTNTLPTPVYLGNARSLRPDLS